MKYRKDKYGNELSILGYGCMRFPKKHGIGTQRRIIFSSRIHNVNGYQK